MNERVTRERAADFPKVTQQDAGPHRGQEQLSPPHRPTTARLPLKAAAPRRETFELTARLATWWGGGTNSGSPCLAASRDVAPSARTKAPRHVSSTPQGCVRGPCSHHSPCISSPQEGKRLPRCYYFPNTIIPSTLAAPPGKRWPSPPPR